MSDQNEFDDDQENIDDGELSEFDDSAGSDDSSDWEDYDEDGGDEDVSLDASEEDQDSKPGKPKGKKSNLFTIVIVAAAIALGGGFFVLKSGGTSKTATPPASNVAAAAKKASTPQEVPGLPGVPAEPARQVDVPPPPVAPTEPSKAEGDKGFLNDPDAMNKLQKDLDQIYETTEVVLEEKSVEKENIPVLPMPTAVTSPPPQESETGALDVPVSPEAIDAIAESAQGNAPSSAVTASPGLPKIDDIMIKSSGNESVSAEPDPVRAVETVVETAQPSVQQPVAASQDDPRIDVAIDRLEKIERSLAELKANPPTVPQSDNDNKEIVAAVDGLRKSMEALNRRVDELAASARSDADTQQRVPEPAQAEPQETLAPPPAKPKPQILGPGPESAAESAIVASPKAPAALSPSDTVRGSSSWVLKGAQPGQAMVSKAGEGEMQSVKVGDTLSGIGRIEEISYQDGRWVVRGTQGRITQ